MREEVIRVQGMYCTNCEKRIQKRMMQTDGVAECHADYQTEQVRIVFDEKRVDLDRLCSSIEELGYEIRRDSSRYIQIISILVILLALYLIAGHLGLLSLFNIFPVIETTMNYGTVFVIGLLTSVHCIAMCGGINLTQSVLSSERKSSVIRSNLLYNLGRVISYTLIGGIVGSIGGVITLGGRLKGMIAIFTGVIMLIMSFRMLGVFKIFRRFRLPVPTGVFRFAGRFFRGRSSFVIGLLNGLMPCGPLQSMQIYALSTGSFWGGALSMFLFSLGTVPLMFGLGAVSGKLNKTYAKYMLTVSAMVIFVLGLSMMGNGLSLSGVQTFGGSSSGEKTAMVNGEVQTVRTEVDYGSYESIVVKSQVPVEWTIYVPEGKLNGCNGEILAPEYDLDVKLQEGENVVTFTPRETGTFPYGCWMGMIKSSIRVVE